MTATKPAFSMSFLGLKDRSLLAGRRHHVLLTLWLCFLLRGWFYCNFTPIWEGYDEPFHFAFLQFVVHNHGKLPTLNQTYISREVEQSLHLVPVPWMLRAAVPSPVMTEEAYWQRNARDRQPLQSELNSLPTSWAGQPGTQLRNYEAQQAPLYYWFLSPLLVTTRSQPLPERVMWLRYANLLLASLLVPLAFVIARRVLGNRWQALTTVALMISMPEMFVNFCRVANETMAAVLYTLFVLLLLDIEAQPERLAAFSCAGVVLGLGLLTKAYFLAALPALALVVTRQGWRRRTKPGKLLLNSFIACLIAITVAGWWYGRNIQNTGSLSGDLLSARLHRSSVLPVTQVLHVNWKSGVVSIVLSHIWFGDWSFLRVPNWMYALFGFAIVAAVAGNLVVAYRCIRHRSLGGEIQCGHLFVLWTVYGSFWIGLGYSVLVTYAARGLSSSTGWYMYCLVVAELILLLVGLGTLAGLRRIGGIAAVLTAGLALLDLYSVNFLSIPYYTGLRAHDPQGRVTAAGWSQLRAAGLHTLVNHLQVNKPRCLTGTTLGVSWLLFVAATSLVVFIGFYCARQERVI